MGLPPAQGDENAFCPATALHGSVPLPFVIPSPSTCLRQVEGEMNDIHWDSWWGHQIQGERRPPLCHSERSRGICSFPFPVSNAYGGIVLFIRSVAEGSAVPRTIRGNVFFD